MACLLRGLDAEETLALTQAMVESGDTVRFDGLERPAVDKHSTGGVADGVTLVFAPAGRRARAGGGQALGPRARAHRRDAGQARVDPRSPHGSLARRRSGGRSRRWGARWRRSRRTWCRRTARSTRCATRRRPCHPFPLIAASVMSKKLAVGTDLILLDVKAGSGAFMKTPEDARDARRGLSRARLRLRTGGRARPSPTCPSLSGTPSATRSTSRRRSPLLRGEARGRLRELAAAVRRARARADSGSRPRRGARAGGRGDRRAERLSSGSGRWSRRRAAIRASSTIRRASSRELRSASRCSRTGAVSSPRCEAEEIGLASVGLGRRPAPEGRRRSTRPSVSWCDPKIGDRLEAGEPIGEVARARSRRGGRGRPSRPRRDGRRRRSRRASAARPHLVVTWDVTALGNFTVLGLRLAALHGRRRCSSVSRSASTRGRGRPRRLGDPTPRLWGRADAATRSRGSIRSGAGSCPRWSRCSGRVQAFFMPARVRQARADRHRTTSSAIRGTSSFASLAGPAASLVARRSSAGLVVRTGVSRRGAPRARRRSRSRTRRCWSSTCCRSPASTAGVCSPCCSLRLPAMCSGTRIAISP